MERMTRILATAVALLVGGGRVLAQAPDGALDTDAPAPERDALTVYVSTTDGHDGNKGTSPNAPLATLGRATAMMRDGHGDSMLLKRGDEWTESFGEWTLSGESPDAPMVIGCYGEEGARPTILTAGATPGIVVPKETKVSNLVLRGLRFLAFERSPGSPAFRITGDRPVGIQWDGGGKNVLLEDCAIEAYAVGIALNATADAPLENVTIRRCLVAECYAEDESHGIHAVHVNGLKMDQCVLDFNGWHPVVRRSGEGLHRPIGNAGIRAEPTVQDVNVTGSVIARCSGSGLDLAAGGIVEGCLITGNAVGVYVGRTDEPPAKGANARIAGNVFASGADPTDGVGGRGVVMANVRGVEVSGNAFIGNQAQSHETAFAVHVLGRIERGSIGSADVLIKNNTMCNWSGYRLEPAASVRYEMSDIRVFDNLIQCTTREDVLARMDVGTGPQYMLARNLYFSKRAAAEWFLGGRHSVDYLTWVRATGEKWSDVQEVTFKDSQRTVAAYHKSIGGQGTEDGFIRELRNRAVGAWDENQGAAKVISYILEGFTPSARPRVRTAGASPFTEEAADEAD